MSTLLWTFAAIGVAFIIYVLVERQKARQWREAGAQAARLIALRDRPLMPKQYASPGAAATTAQRRPAMQKTTYVDDLPPIVTSVRLSDLDEPHISDRGYSYQDRQH